MSAPTDAKRLFLALPVDADDRQRLGELQSVLRHALRDAELRWVDPNDFHLTLRFFGRTDPELFVALRALCDELAAASQTCGVALSGIDAWPSARPRVIVARFEPDAVLAELAASAEREARALGFAPQRRPFRPHVTFARGPGQAVAMPRFKLAPLEMSCGAWTLFESTPALASARYRALHTAALAGC